MKDPFIQPVQVGVTERGQEVFGEILGDIPDDAVVIVCMPTSMDPGWDDAQVGGKCAGCGSPCWVAPSSQKVVDAGAVIVCMRCLTKRMEH